MAQNNLGLAYEFTDQPARAKGLYTQVHEALARKYTPTHPLTIPLKHNLASAARQMGDLPQVQAQYHVQLHQRMLRYAFGLSHPETLEMMLASAWCNLQTGSLQEAERAIQEYLTQRDPRGKSDGRLFYAHGLLGAVRLRQKNFAEAEPWLFTGCDGLLAIQETNPDEVGQPLREALSWIVDLYAQWGQPEQAAYWRAHLQALQTSPQNRPAVPLPIVLQTEHQLRSYHQALQRPMNGFSLRMMGGLPYRIDLTSKNSSSLNPFLQIEDEAGNVLASDDDSGGSKNARLIFRPPMTGVYHLIVVQDRHALEPVTLTVDPLPGILQQALDRSAQKDHRGAETLARHAVLLRRYQKPDDTALAAALAVLAMSQLQQHQFEAAEKNCRECLTLREKHFPDHWVLFNTRSLLGACLLGQKKYAEAEPLLLAGYAGMKAREPTIPAAAQVRLAEAVERLVQLYEVTGAKEKTEQWRETLRKEKLPE
jgi:hypothetical protein